MQQHGKPLAGREVLEANERRHMIGATSDNRFFNAFARRCPENKNIVEINVGRPGTLRIGPTVEEADNPRPGLLLGWLSSLLIERQPKCIIHVSCFPLRLRCSG